jgi:hypothetical protein
VAANEFTNARRHPGRACYFCGDRDRFAQLPSGKGGYTGNAAGFNLAILQNRANISFFSIVEHHGRGDKGQDRRHRSIRQSQGKPGPKSANAA